MRIILCAEALAVMSSKGYFFGCSHSEWGRSRCLKLLCLVLEKSFSDAWKTYAAAWVPSAFLFAPSPVPTAPLILCFLFFVFFPYTGLNVTLPSKCQARPKTTFKKSELVTSHNHNSLESSGMIGDRMTEYIDTHTPCKNTVKPFIPRQFGAVVSSRVKPVMKVQSEIHGYYCCKNDLHVTGSVSRSQAETHVAQNRCGY